MNPRDRAARDMLMRIEAWRLAHNHSIVGSKKIPVTSHKINNHKPDDEMTFEVGDEVTVDEGFAPAGFDSDRTYTIKCVHPERSQAYIFGVGEGVSGLDCDEHRSTWMVRYRDMKLASKKKTKPKVVISDAEREKALDKVIVPDDVRKEVLAVLKQSKNQSLIFDDWGLSSTIGYGKGMVFLFWGKPGTGKTFMARAIAEYMGTEVHEISPAAVQSSEPGAANRNLMAAFKTAKEKKKVLLIDECDSLVSDRSSMGMILSGEVNTLLTEIEKFEGVLVLTTNRADHLDPALERRVSLMCEFKNPTKEMRMKIWASITPHKLPLGSESTKTTDPETRNIFFERLSEHKLSGGQIKNALLNASRIAASEESKFVDMTHFERAIERIKASHGILGTGGVRQRGSSGDYTVVRPG